MSDMCRSVDSLNLPMVVSGNDLLRCQSIAFDCMESIQMSSLDQWIWHNPATTRPLQFGSSLLVLGEKLRAAAK